MKIKALVSQNLPTLARKRIHGITIDPYGIVNADRWNKECQHFVNKVVRPQLTTEEANAVAEAGLSEIATQLIERPAQNECKRLKRTDEYDTSIRTEPSHGSSCATSHSLYSSGSSGRTTQMTISRGLIIRPEPLENILAGRKTWEMRSRPIDIRGTIALVKKGSKAIYGVADIVDSRGPLSRTEMLANQSRHLISPDRLDHPDVAKYRHAWVLSNIRCLNVAIPYIHRGGVQFVTLDEVAVKQLASALRAK